jgi:hypothetical protein
VGGTIYGQVRAIPAYSYFITFAFFVAHSDAVELISDCSHCVEEFQRFGELLMRNVFVESVINPDYYCNSNTTRSRRESVGGIACIR